MRKLSILFIIVVCFFTSSVADLILSPNGRYLTTPDGTPYLVMADAAWNLLHMLGTDSAKWYLARRQQEGFNAFIVWAPAFASNSGSQIWPVTDRYGNAPFAGAVFQSTLNEAYWAHVDTVIDYGKSLGLNFIIFPAYLGYLCNSTNDGGWYNEVNAATNAQMTAYGTALGNRYKSRSNIIWGVGGDVDLNTCTNAKTRITSMLDGISGAGDTHLVLNHSGRGTVGTGAWTVSGVIDLRITLNDIYTGSVGDPPGSTDTNECRLAQAAYNINPVKPFVLIEAYYEGDGYGATQQVLRAQSYRAVVMGGCGWTFGQTNLFNFGGDGTYWPNYINTTGATCQSYAKAIISSRHWWTLVPDNAHTILTSGYGTFGTSTYVTAAGTSDSSSIVAYLPTQRSVTINPSSLKGDSVHVWWYNPSNGVFTDAGMYSKENRSYNPPSAGDWVLVIDSKGLTFTNIAIDETQSFPYEFNLRQNYPNPFNPATNIVYTLPRRVHVTLDLYNILGQHIERIVDEIQSAGYHQVKVDGKQLTSGLYLYRMEAGNFIQTKKLILLK